MNFKYCMRRECKSCKRYEECFESPSTGKEAEQDENIDSTKEKSKKVKKVKSLFGRYLTNISKK